MHVVTGVAGFIGSRLAHRLLDDGHQVVGIDAMTDYYDPARKLDNIAPLLSHRDFELQIRDLASARLSDVLRGAECVFHLAGQPGVRMSWGEAFGDYTRNNVLATQALLEACVSADVRRVVYASSSSVYGEAPEHPTHEGVVPQPVSPYGVTKLAAEHLCLAYSRSHQMATAALRLFTVYGPGQRPDMAFSKLVEAAVHGHAFTLNDDGEQLRDFTYVDDVVDAFVAASTTSWTGVANIGAGAPVTMNAAIALVSGLTGPVTVRRGPAQAGDVRHTFASIETARRALGYSPQVALTEGLARMVDWSRVRAGTAA